MPKKKTTKKKTVTKQKKPDYKVFKAAIIDVETEKHLFVFPEMYQVIVQRVLKSYSKHSGKKLQIAAFPKAEVDKKFYERMQKKSATDWLNDINDYFMGPKK